MTDQWGEILRCPQCSNTGAVSLSQSDEAKMPTVRGISDGFRLVQTEYGPDFHCGDCNLPAIP
jgi:hypothetical protein